MPGGDLSRGKSGGDGGWKRDSENSAAFRGECWERAPSGEESATGKARCQKAQQDSRIGQAVPAPLAGQKLGAARGGRQVLAGHL